MFDFEIPLMSGYGYYVEPDIKVNHVFLYINVGGIDYSPDFLVGNGIFRLTVKVCAPGSYFGYNQTVPFPGYNVQLQSSPSPVPFQYLISIFLEKPAGYVFSSFAQNVMFCHFTVFCKNTYLFFLN